MRHKWIKNSDLKGVYICKVCGCKRYMSFQNYKGKVFKNYIWERSGHILHLNSPECIDWKLENAKTID